MNWHLYGRLALQEDKPVMPPHLVLIVKAYMIKEVVWVGLILYSTDLFLKS